MKKESNNALVYSKGCLNAFKIKRNDKFHHLCIAKVEKYILFSVLKNSEGKKQKCWWQLCFGGRRFMGFYFAF